MTHTTVLVNRGNTEERDFFFAKTEDKCYQLEGTHISKVRRLLKQFVGLDFECHMELKKETHSETEIYLIYRGKNEQPFVRVTMTTHFPICRSTALVKNPKTLNDYNRFVYSIGELSPVTHTMQFVNLFKELTPYQHPDYVFDVENHVGFYVLSTEHRRRHFSIDLELDLSAFKQ